MLPVAGLSGYELRELIHQGTNTIIYRAISTADRQFAILKVLNPDCPTLGEIAILKHKYQITKTLESEYIIKAHRLEVCHKSLFVF